MFRLLFAVLPAAIAGFLSVSQAFAINCAPTSIPEIVHSEGITERTSDLIFSCSGGSADETLTANLNVFLNVNITNRLASATSDVLTGITLTADNGGGAQVISSSAMLQGPATLVFNGASFTLSPTGSVTLQIAGLRGAANELETGATIQATLAVSGSTEFLLTANQLLVAQLQHGLYVDYSGKLICAQSGSPAPPGTTSFAGFLAANSVFTSTRLTEGYAGSFGPKSDPQNLNADTGTRIVIQYSGFPAGAQIFVPAVVAGSDATQPTAGGDLGVKASGGEYTPGSVPSLLLSLVPYTDANGAGGTPTYVPGAPGLGTVSFDQMRPVTLTNGSGIVVYEVMDANPSVQESAQFPTFLVLAPNPNATPVTTSENATLGPVSTVDTAAVGDPIPRFQQTTPTPDCTILGDCDAPYFPALAVTSSTLDFATPAGGPTTTQYLAVQNAGGGVLSWTATVTYLNGSGWLNVSPTSGVNKGGIRVDAIPGTLVPGTYKANLIVDAGQFAGTKTIAITFVVSAATPNPGPAITSAVNAATFATGPLTPGSIATLSGSNFADAGVSVTFSGIGGQVLFSNATQINVVVPSLTGKTSAPVVVTVGGIASTPFNVTLAPFAPGIFANGILNEDNSVNGSENPAAPGSVIQIFATGLSGTGMITAKIGSQVVTQPYYAGPAPGFNGLQQIDLILPTGLTGSSVNVSVCGGATTAQSVCSPSTSVFIQ